MLAEWVSLAPNAFLRALNGALLGQLTVDLLPGSTLTKIVQYYPEFGHTVFSENPTILYKTSSVKLVKRIPDPPTLETVISIPRIMEKFII